MSGAGLKSDESGHADLVALNAKFKKSGLFLEAKAISEEF